MVPHVGQEVWGVHNFTHSLYITEFVSLRINDSGLFAWISLTALSRTYFIVYLLQR